MKKPVFKLRSISRHADGKVYASLVQEQPEAKILMAGPIEKVLDHAMAQGFVLENVSMEPVAPNAVAPEVHPEDKINA